MIDIIKTLNKLQAYGMIQTNIESIYIGGQFRVTKDACEHFIDKGWWHIIPICKDENALYGLRIFPDKPWDTWPVVITIDNNRAYTFAPTLKSFPFFLKFYYALEDNELIGLFRDDWDGYLQNISPLVDVLDNDNELNMFKNFIFNYDYSQYIPSNNVKKDFLFKRFWLHFGDCPSLAELEDFIDKSYIPADSKIEQKNEVWTSRLTNLIIAEELKKNNASKNRDSLLLHFLNLDCFDSDLYEKKILSSYSGEPYMIYEEACNQISFLFKDSIMDKSLGLILISAFNKTGKNMYDGMKHLDAAAADTDAISAWRHLLNASYWYGKNKNTALVPAWNFAINLCHINGWQEAKRVLEYQLEFYHT